MKNENIPGSFGVSDDSTMELMGEIDAQTNAPQKNHEDEAPGEITCLLDDLSNEQAAEALWRHYFPKLVAYAKGKMRELPSSARDEEDVALSAINSFFTAAEHREFDLKNRDALWRLLLTITFRKITRERRRQFAQKRGGGIAHIGNHHGNGVDPINSIADSSQMPEFIEDVHQQCSELLQDLPDEALRLTAQMKLEGCSNDEISDLLRCKPHETKERLNKIRNIWRKHQESLGKREID